MRLAALAVLAMTLLMNSACAGNRNIASEEAEPWQPSKSVAGAATRNLVGDRARPGPFRFQLKVPAGARAEAHRHSVAVRVKVLSGSMFIIIGEPLDPARAQHFRAGSTFLIPANAWHVEWWDEDSVMEGEGVGPMVTETREVN